VVEPAIISATSALAGTAIGAISSLVTAWLTSKSEARLARITAERAKREELYGRYMDELAVLYTNALNSTQVDYERLTVAYALSGRISLYATQPVTDEAVNALRFIVDLALGPTRSQAEMRALMDDANNNVLRTFARACRDELDAIK
jgi:hypothetical protein